MTYETREEIETRIGEIKARLIVAQTYCDTEWDGMMQTMAKGMVRYLVHILGAERGKLAQPEHRFAA